jgi:chemotaxis-related protein WspB
VLALAFHIGDERFALSCADVVEVVPRVRLREIPHAPPYVGGMLTYRGAIVPVVDLCRLTRGTPCPERLSSRIVLVRFERHSKQRLVGLLAERITDTVNLDEGAAVAPGIEIAGAPYLGEIHFDGQSTIQILHVDKLLTETLHELLYGAEPAA